MKFERKDASFDLPEKITVRQQLAYYSEIALATGGEMFARLWSGAKPLLQNWQSDVLPDLSVDIDEIDNPRVTEIIIWTAFQVKRYMDGLDSVEKN